MNKAIHYFVLLVLAACSSVPEDTAGPLLLDLDGAAASANDIPLSVVASSLEYIPLETNDSCLLGEFSSIYVYDNYIIADVWGGIPQVFDRKGKFLNSIGRRGKGRGEIGLQNYDLSFNPGTGRVSLHFYNRVMYFDITGKYLSEDTLRWPREKCDMFDIGGTDRYTVILANSPDSSRVYMLDRSSETLQLLPVAFSSYPYRNKRGEISTYIYKANFENDYMGYYDVSGQSYFCFYYDGRIANPYKMRFGMKNRLGMNMKPTCFINTRDYLFMCFGESEVLQFVYLKTRGKLLCMRCEKNGLVNDLDSGADFYPDNITSDGKLFMVRQALWFKRRAAESSNSELRALADKLKDDDNPVLMLVTLKK